MCSHVCHVPAPLRNDTGTCVHICGIPAFPHVVVGIHVHTYAMPQSHHLAECVCPVTHVPWPRSVIWQLGHTCLYACHVLVSSLISVHVPALTCHDLAVPDGCVGTSVCSHTLTKDIVRRHGHTYSHLLCPDGHRLGADMPVYIPVVS